MISNNEQQPPVGPKKNKHGITEDERASHEAFDRQQQYDNSDDEASVRERDETQDEDREDGENKRP